MTRDLIGQKHFIRGMYLILPGLIVKFANNTKTRAFSHEKMEKAVSKLESDRLNMAVTTIEMLISKIISKASASRVYVCLWTITSTS